MSMSMSMPLLKKLYLNLFFHLIYLGKNLQGNPCPLEACSWIGRKGIGSQAMITPNKEDSNDEDKEDVDNSGGITTPNVESSDNDKQNAENSSSVADKVLQMVQNLNDDKIVELIIDLMILLAVK